ncbi:HGxxPAAW family protein [Streptomyces sp. FZ201]|uniref:HGxxPAAW family protein n=1 Tax=Streptomyces sp. FZ201 TaxID=3057122 RepID=UPI0021C0BEFD|nr:HGxxPAAW family protein [Streptomyces sp. FZ201]
MSAQYDEGHTVAGWTGTAIATVGGSVAGAGVCLVSPLVVGGGLGICLLALLTTWSLHLTGWGKGPGPRPREQWPMGVRDPQARAGHPECLGCRLAGRGRRGRGRPEALAVAAVSGEEAVQLATASGEEAVQLTPAE